MGIRDKIDDYRQEAAARAQRRKSKANLLLFILRWPLMIVLWLWMARSFYILAKGPVCAEGFFRCLPEGFWTGLYMVSWLFAAIPLSMLLTNALLWCVPPLRRIFEREAKGYAGTDYRSMQMSLLRLGLPVLAVCAGVAYFALKNM